MILNFISHGAMNREQLTILILNSTLKDALGLVFREEEHSDLLSRREKTGLNRGLPTTNRVLQNCYQVYY